MGELVYKTDWDNASESDIEKILRLLQEKGSTWADDVLASGEYRNLDKETEDDFYRQMFLEVESLEAREEEDANLERIRQEFEAGGSGSSSIPSGYRGDRMPFGKSMFGPWDTGIGPSGP
ncbi:MAG: hypothetical protein R3E76_12795 [Planctomycetota bacterium]